jgi:hypothetical protein
MQPGESFGGNLNELLMEWIRGKSVPDLFQQFLTESGSLEDLARFIGDKFTYKFPWGISAYVRLAKHLLGLKDDEIAAFAKFLPTMAKYGVPSPIASWALAIGVPFRGTAIKLAQKYLMQNGKVDTRDFLRWFGNLDPEELVREYDLKGVALEEVSKAIMRSASNPLLASYSGPAKFFPHETWIKGIKYDNRPLTAMKAKEGQKLELVRDYDNWVDRNAIEVRLDREPVGYLSRSLAQVVAPDIDSGANIEAEIMEIEKHDVPEIKIRLNFK